MSDKSTASSSNSSDPCPLGALSRAAPSDPLAETWEKLEVVRRRLADDMKDKETEFERFKEETLWRLNALSDRTIETARMEENDTEERLARNREKADAEFAEWKAHLDERSHDEKLLDALAENAFEGLLPFSEPVADDTLRSGGDGT
ncbi:MAG: hypothetical protein LBJ22_01240 [Synergistaceae bacterium]|jgi:hypothetical protein|nr:hypothetical protein [Synergistaceae bacterium]